MELLASIIVVPIMYAISNMSFNSKVDNYPISKVDSSKLCADAHKGAKTVQKNMINGKYDK